MGLVIVTTPAELTSAISAAQAGDEIVLADGTYPLTGVTCGATGTETQPIVVRAQNPLGAHVELDALEGFKVTGAHWHFEGLDVTGVCAVDSSCEHAFHVMGAAVGFVLRGSRVRDFNAQLKVNASKIDTTWVTPDRGLIEYNELADTRARNTSNPVTKLNIDTGDDWIIRGNYIHDAQKAGGDNISYATFLKSGGKRGVIERNLVVCSRDTTGGTRIGLSFGGGGTGAQFCAPAFDPDVPCSVEHEGGTMRNNIIASCSDVGIYLNRAKDTHLLYNTLISTGGVDFRFDTTSGEAVGNVLSGMIRTRDNATMTATSNQQNLAVSQLLAWYRDPLIGDLTVIGDVSVLKTAGPTRADVLNDYCVQQRPSTMYTLGAIEHAVGTCDTTRPPVDPHPTGDSDGASIAGDDTGVSSTQPGGCCDTGGSRGTLPLALVVLVGLFRQRGRSVTRRCITSGAV